MATPLHSHDPLDESPAIRELRARLRQIQTELETLQVQRGQLDQVIEAKRRESDALSISIGSLGGTDPPDTRNGPSIEVHYQGADRPTIRIIAREHAQQSGGTLKVRDLLRETRRLGFKSDQGGLHTYLKGLQEFTQSGPGEFRLRISDGDRHAEPPTGSDERDP